MENIFIEADLKKKTLLDVPVNLQLMRSQYLKIIFVFYKITKCKNQQTTWKLKVLCFFFFGS